MGTISAPSERHALSSLPKHYWPVRAETCSSRSSMSIISALPSTQCSDFTSVLELKTLSPRLKSTQSPAQICSVSSSTLSSNLLDLKSRPTQCYPCRTTSHPKHSPSPCQNLRPLKPRSIRSQIFLIVADLHGIVGIIRHSDLLPTYVLFSPKAWRVAIVSSPIRRLDSSIGRLVPYINLTALSLMIVVVFE